MESRPTRSQPPTAPPTRARRLLPPKRLGPISASNPRQPRAPQPGKPPTRQTPPPRFGSWPRSPSRASVTSPSPTQLRTEESTPAETIDGSPRQCQRRGMPRPRRTPRSRRGWTPIATPPATGRSRSFCRSWRRSRIGSRGQGSRWSPLFPPTRPRGESQERCRHDRQEELGQKPGIPGIRHR